MPKRMPNPEIAKTSSILDAAITKVGMPLFNPVAVYVTY